ncbi:MAG: insulinase family protein, partial [Bdellovibrionales bacterium]|nr:insulinase family protein [Bdellovibrionales bacterium]
FADVMFDSYLFGSHPYARRILGRKRDVQKMRRKNIIKYYLSYYRPNNAQLAVVGQFGPDIVKELEGAFKSWVIRDQKKASFPEVPPIAAVQIHLIDKGDLPQSQIRLGHLGIKRTDPDYLKLRVANMILGGAFHSRLVDEIRDRRGLTYSINSEFDSRLDTGPFTISTFTRHEKVGETIGETLSVLRQFRDHGVTEKEVEDAQALLRGIFPRALETADRLAQTLLILRFYGVPDSYLTSYMDEIAKITTSQVNETIRNHIKPENLKILVYSPKGKVLEQLRPLGVVQVKDYTHYIQ